MREWRHKIDGSNILYLNRRAKDRFDSWLREYPRATPVVVFCAVLALVLSAAWSVDRADKRIWQTQQQAKVADMVSALERQAASDSAYLSAMGALLANVGNPSPQTFQNYVDRLRGLPDLNGIAGLGWIERFDERDLPDLQRRLAESGSALPRPPASGPPLYWPFYLTSMLEPRAEGDSWSTRIDSQGAAPWAGAVEKVRQTGKISTTGPAAMPAGEPGFLVLAPVRALRGEPDFRGVAFVLLRTADFAQSAIGPRLKGGGRVELFNRFAGGQRRIFEAQEGKQRFGDPISRTVTVFDQRWVLNYEPPERLGLSALSLVILFGGMAFATLLLAYVLLVQRRTADLHALLDVQMMQERERTAFIRELNHRVKNTLANVTSIISLTRNRASNVESFADMLLQRVRALAAGHSLLDSGQWGPADLRAIFSTQLNAHDRAKQISLEGPDVSVSPNDALTIGLAVHELATNSVRFGALSTEAGSLTVRWQIADDNWVQVDWEERGGPPVEPPEKLGFGLSLVQRALAHELRRPIDLVFDPAGFRCRFFFQLRAPRSFQLRN